MTKFTKLMGATAMALTMGNAAFADCAAEGRMSIIGNEFPAIQSVAALALECEGVDGESNLTADHQTLNVPGMSGNPAEYTAAIVANSSIVALMNEDVIRPLDDLVAEYGAEIPAHMKITVDGNIMAIAFMANAQHLVYRGDILEQVGLDVPTSYEEVLAAAAAIREADIMEYPVGGAYASGWNLG